MHLAVDEKLAGLLVGVESDQGQHHGDAHSPQSIRLAHRDGDG